MDGHRSPFSTLEWRETIEKTILPSSEVWETPSAFYKEYFTALNDAPILPCEISLPGSHLTTPYTKEHIPLLTYLTCLDAASTRKLTSQGKGGKVADIVPLYSHPLSSLTHSF